MQELNCTQVITLLTFFIDEKLTPKLMEQIEFHLTICPECRKKYLQLQKIFNNYEEIKSKIDNYDEGYQNNPENDYKKEQYENFKNNLSAYIDNELSDKDNIKIKKISITNSKARKELEDMLSFQQLLKNAFTKTKNSFKEDFAEYTINKLYNSGHISHRNISTGQYALTFSIIIACLTIISIYVFYH